MLSNILFNICRYVEHPTAALHNVILLQVRDLELTAADESHLITKLSKAFELIDDYKEAADDAGYDPSWNRM